MLIENIIKFQNGSKKIFEEIMNEFSTLIKFLSKKIANFSVENELYLELFKICEKIDVKKFEDNNFIRKYIKVCLINYSNKLYKKYTNNNEIINSDICDLYNNSSLTSTFDEYEIYFFDLISLLPKRTQEILKLKYIQQYTDKEIGIKLNLSRQAVNKILNKSLIILKENIIKNSMI